MTSSSSAVHLHSAVVSLHPAASARSQHRDEVLVNSVTRCPRAAPAQRTRYAALRQEQTGGGAMVQTQMTRDDVLATFEQIKNWGRWGADDERGALNFITPEHRRRAAATVTD